MKKLAISMFALVALLSLNLSSMAAKDAKDAAKEETLKGTMKCAKCSLKEADKCQAVLVTKDGEKEVKYYIVGPKAAAEHKEICKADKENVTLTGTVTEKDGKKQLTVTKAE
jgi:outer membrane lipoprotein-sorting protein